MRVPCSGRRPGLLSPQRQPPPHAPAAPVALRWDSLSAALDVPTSLQGTQPTRPPHLSGLRSAQRGRVGGVGERPSASPWAASVGLKVKTDGFGVGLNLVVAVDVQL